MTSPGSAHGRDGELPLFLVFSQNYSPETLLKLNAATWTLAVEVAFYLLLPLIGLLALRAAAAARGGRWRCSPRSSAVGIAWNVLDYFAGWGPVASHSAAVVPALFRLRHAGRPARRASRARGLPPLGRADVIALLAAAGRLMLVANGYLARERPHADGFLMEAFADLPRRGRVRHRSSPRS